MYRGEQKYVNDWNTAYFWKIGGVYSSNTRARVWNKTGKKVVVFTCIYFLMKSSCAANARKDLVRITTYKNILGCTQVRSHFCAPTAWKTSGIKVTCLNIENFATLYDNLWHTKTIMNIFKTLLLFTNY